MPKDNRNLLGRKRWIGKPHQNDMISKEKATKNRIYNEPEKEFE